jgi:3-hydroxyisobutyrate dehydrogenase
MGTMSPDHIADLVTRAPQGVTVIDAPVSGATQAARDAQLLIMAGCDAETGAPVGPLLDAMGRQTVFLGRAGAGAVMKLGVNMLIHGLNQTLAEALALTRAAGIPRDAAFDVIEASAAAAPMLSYRKPLYLDDATGDVTFTVGLARKDMAVTAALADRLGVALPQGTVTLAQLEEAIAHGYGERDMAAIVPFMEDKTR